MSTLSERDWDGGRKRDLEDVETDCPRKKAAREGGADA